VTRRWWICVGLALLALSVAMGAVGAAGKPPHKRKPPGKRLFVVGDSLAVGTRPFLPRFLHGWRIRSSVSISKHAPEGASELARKGHSLPPVVVASLGTNDDPHADSSFEAAVRKSLRATGKRGCIVWPNIVRPSVAGATYAGYNNVLDHIASRNPHLRVVDWVSIAAHHRSWFGSDGVHPNATGYTVRAAAIAKKVRRCRRFLAK
jgi:lysophospholipase L1-like esterase